MANFGTSIEDMYNIYFVYLFQLITLLKMLSCHINRASVYLVAKLYLLHSYNTINALSIWALIYYGLNAPFSRATKMVHLVTYPGFYGLLKYNFALYFWMLCFHYRHWGVGAYCDNASIPCVIMWIQVSSSWSGKESMVAGHLPYFSTRTK